MRSKVNQVVVLAALAAAGVTQAQSVWTGAATNWSSNGNPGWNGTGVPNAIDATANIAAASGNITVNGAYTLGTLTAGGTYNGRTLATSLGNLTFDVSAGNALFDLSNGGAAGAGILVNTELTLNDTTEIRNLVSSGSQTVTLAGKISGVGSLSLTNTGTTGGGARYDIRNGSNDFAGGINVGAGVGLRINASGALGAGTLTRASSIAGGNNDISFRNDTGNATQVHPNSIDFGSNASGSASTFSLLNSSMNVTLNGVISGTMGNANRASLNGGTLVLGGASANTWTGIFRSDTHGTIITAKADAIDIGFDMRSQVAGATTALLIGATDTIPGQITFNGTNSGTGIAYTGQLGLANGNNGTVTFSNANKINLANVYGGVGGTDLLPNGPSLNLHSGNGTGTLVVTTEIGQNTNARSISVTGTGTVNLNRPGGNSYTGTTTVSGGTLRVNNTSGSATGPGSVTVASGAALGGSGIITGVTTVSGSVRPGNSIGQLTVANDVTWHAGDAWVFELGAPAADLALANLAPATSNDRLNITGAGNDFLKGSGTGWTFDFANTGTDGVYKLVDWAGTTDFAALDFVASNLPTGKTATFTVDGSTSALYVTLIPEPATLGLLGMGAMGLGRRRRH